MKDADFRADWHNTACRVLRSSLCKGHADYVTRLAAAPGFRRFAVASTGDAYGHHRG